jgi:hypothetical protein
MGSAGQDEYESLAFVIPNRKDWPGGTALPDYLKSIDWIEERCGYDFFPERGTDPDIIQMESRTPSRLWAVSERCEKQD